MEFIFSKRAKAQWERLGTSTQDRIKEKLIYLKSREVFLKNCKTVSSIPPATHRLRIGNHRLLMQCDFSKQEAIILKIADRKDIYK